MVKYSSVTPLKLSKNFLQSYDWVNLTVSALFFYLKPSQISSFHINFQVCCMYEPCSMVRVMLEVICALFSHRNEKAKYIRLPAFRFYWSFEGTSGHLKQIIGAKLLELSEFSGHF